jgi:fused signal recognition particle receptor
MTDTEKKGWFRRFRNKESSETHEPAPVETEQSMPVIANEDQDAKQPQADTVPTAPIETTESIVVGPEPTSEQEETAIKAPSTDGGEEQKGWFGRLRQGLKKSTSALSGGISGIFTQRKLDDETLEELEDLLITADLGVAVAGRVATAFSKDRFNKEISDEEVKNILAGEIESILSPVAKPIEIKPANKPHVILMAGVNGAGKTTTIGKLGKKFKDEGKSVMLAAGDTFRAAAVEQLQVWGERVGVPVITKDIGADAAALAYEAMERAVADKIDVLLIDTAGRLQNREELMAELAKVVRVIGKKMDGAPHDTIIVLDASTGQNAVHQVEVFQKLANISGIVMTKLDGSARGGVLVACADKFGLPVHAIGVGEAIEDLQPFNARDFARALVGIED